MGRLLDFDGFYVCPDCGAEIQGCDLQNNWDELYVCPECGCIQSEAEVDAQLGYDDIDEEDE